MLNIHVQVNQQNIKTALSEGGARRLDEFHDAVKKSQVFLI